jgi:hypothetical protein
MILHGLIKENPMAQGVNFRYALVEPGNAPQSGFLGKMGQKFQ